MFSFSLFLCVLFNGYTRNMSAISYSSDDKIPSYHAAKQPARLPHPLRSPKTRNNLYATWRVVQVRRDALNAKTNESLLHSRLTH